MGAVFIDSMIADEARRARLYAGDVFILSPTSGTRALINLAGKSICTARPQNDTRVQKGRGGRNDTWQAEAEIHPSSRLQADNTANYAGARG
jgi:hypothetical protein